MQLDKFLGTQAKFSKEMEPTLPFACLSDRHRQCVGVVSVTAIIELNHKATYTKQNQHG
jgi:hypothetical protein